MQSPLLRHQPDAVWFAALSYHYASLLRAHRDNTMWWPHCLCDDALKALRLVSQGARRIVEQTVPAVFARYSPSLGQLNTIACVQRVLTFYGMAPQTLVYLWQPAMLEALAALHGDLETSRAVVRRGLLRLINGAQHSDGFAWCGENCSVCALSAVRAHFAVVNRDGFAFIDALQRDIATVSGQYQRYTDSVEEVSALLRDALIALALPERTVATLVFALTQECRRRLDPAVQSWAAHALWRCDLYAYLKDGERTALHAHLCMACHTMRLDLNEPRDEAREALRAFYHTHVRSEADWYAKPTTLQSLMRGLTSKTGFQLAIDSLLLERALHHLAQQQLAALAPVTRHLMTCFNETRLEWDTALINGAAALVRALHQANAHTVLADLYDAPLQGENANLQRLVRACVPRQTANYDTVVTLPGGEPIGESCDPLELFVRQGRYDPLTLPTHLQQIEPIIVTMDLRELTDYVAIADTLFPVMAWLLPNKIPHSLVQLLATCYSRLVTAQRPIEYLHGTVRRATNEPLKPMDWGDQQRVCRVKSVRGVVEVSSAHLHQVVACGALWTRVLQWLRVYPPSVLEWLCDAMRLYTAVARRAMFDDEWRCSCGREYSECCTEMAQFYATVTDHDVALLAQLQGLEQEYGETLLRQGDNMMSWTQ